MKKNKETGLCDLNRGVIKGTSKGKIIWQPRIGCWYTDRTYYGDKLPEEYKGMTLPEVYRQLGCSARIYEYGRCFVKKDHPRVQRSSRKLNDLDIEYSAKTPAGTITFITSKTESSWHYKTKKWWITCEEDMKVAAWIEERCSWSWDEAAYRKISKKWGDLGMPTMFMPRVNIQHLYIDMMGVEEATYAMCDYPETVDRYFHILDESHHRLIDAINKSPFENINFGDNLHAGTLSPSLFCKYVLPAYQKRNELLHKANKFTHSHWDGDTKALLPFARECGLDGIEAITPKPQGDVTLDEVKEALGKNMYLIDGVAAILFDVIYPIEELVKQVKQVIQLFAPRLVLGISDEISATGDIQRIKLVGKIVDEYNSQFE